MPRDGRGPTLLRGPLPAMLRSTTYRSAVAQSFRSLPYQPALPSSSSSRRGGLKGLHVRNKRGGESWKGGSSRTSFRTLTAERCSPFSSHSAVNTALLSLKRQIYLKYTLSCKTGHFYTSSCYRKCYIFCKVVKILSLLLNYFPMADSYQLTSLTFEALKNLKLKLYKH